MKRQLGSILTAAALFCAPLAWSQSGTDGGSQAASTSSSQDSSTSSQGGSTSASPGGSASQDPSAAPAQGTSSSVTHGLYTYPSGGVQPGGFTSTTPGAWADPQNGGGGDSTQAGGSNGTQTGASGPQDTFSHPEKLPGLNLFGDVSAHTGLTLFTSVGNIAQEVSQHGSPSYFQDLALLNGGLSISQYRSSSLWSLTYAGGTNVTNGGYANIYTSLSQSGDFHATWNFAKNWQLRIHDNYLYTNDPFQPYLTYFGQPTANNPNPVTYIANAVIEQNNGTVEVTRRLSERDSVNFLGGESFQRFLRGSYGQLNNFSYTGAAFYQHQFSARLAAGAGYVFQALDFGHGQSRAGVSWFQEYVSYRFSQRLSVSGWVGPELTHNKDLIPIFCSPYGCLVDEKHEHKWNVAEGASLTWQASSTQALGVSFSHSVNNGGGILGVSRIYQGTATYTRPISRVWSFSLAAAYNNNLSVSILRANQYLKSWGGTASVGRRLFSDAWNFNAYYGYIRQASNYALLPTLASTNGLGVTVTYGWNHALGR